MRVSPCLFLALALAPEALAAPEVCDGIDNDGDGTADEGPVAGYLDADGDGDGDRTFIVWAPDCSSLPATLVPDGSDCDDSNPEAFLGASELPDTNGVDESCDGVIDEGADPADSDCVLLFDSDSTFLACDDDRTWSYSSTQCGDQGYHLVTIDNATENNLLWPELYSYTSLDYTWWIGNREVGGVWVWDFGSSTYENWAPGQPNASDPCGRIYEFDGEWYDEECSYQRPYICEADCVYHSAYGDDDGDGLGDPSDALLACTLPAGRVWNSGDCNDGDSSVGSYLWYEDADGDGYGSEDAAFSSCSALPQTVALPGDCDDDNPALHPSAPEVCNGASEDCDAEIDEGLDVITWYVDADGDGYGDDSLGSVEDCAPPAAAGYSDSPGDCDDTSPASNPDGTDLPGDGIDQDCDGADAEEIPTDGNTPADTGAATDGAATDSATDSAPTDGTTPDTADPAGYDALPKREDETLSVSDSVGCACSSARPAVSLLWLLPLAALTALTAQRRLVIVPPRGP